METCPFLSTDWEDTTEKATLDRLNYEYSGAHENLKGISQVKDGNNGRFLLNKHPLDIPEVSEAWKRVQRPFI